MNANQLHKQQKQQKKLAAKQQGKSPAGTAAAPSSTHKQKQRPAAAAAAAADTAATPTLLSQLRSADHAFAALLGSTVTPRDFFTNHWEQKPLHISRAKELGSAAAARKFYSGVFSKALFDSYLRAHADELSYGFNLNVCVCSEDGRKIDMNPKLQGAEEEEEQEEEEDEQENAYEEEEEQKAAPVQKKGQKKPSAAAVDDSEEEMETMTIAEALALADAQKKKLRPAGSAAAADAEEDDEEEDDEDDGMDEGEDDEGAGEDADEAAEDQGESQEEEEEEEQLDGTSVSTVKRYAPVRFSDYERLFSSGCTVQALQPQQYTHAMWLLLSQLEEYFGGLAGANCYITPANSQGLAPHYDDVEVFVLQLEGSKAWKLYHPSLSLPRAHSGDFAREEIGAPFRELTLHPGDLMYLPRGVIHEARSSDETSVHMTISVYQKTAWIDFLSTLFPLALNEAFESRSSDAFRRGLPLQYLTYMGSKDALEREIEEGAPDALGISVEQARANSSRHKPLRSSALLGHSRAKLQEAFRAQVDSLLSTLRPILMDKIDDAADEASVDFFTNRLPPAPLLDAMATGTSSAAATEAPRGKGKSRKSLEGEFPEELGPPPVLDGAQIRLLHPSALRMVVVPAQESDSDSEEEEEEGEDEEEESEESKQGHILLTHSLCNSREHHLDGRFPPADPEQSSLQLPLYYAPALLQLLNAPRGVFIPVASLQLEFGGVADAAGKAGNEEEEQAKRSSRLELANTLWLSKLLQTKQAAKQVTAPEEKKELSKGEKAALLNKKRKAGAEQYAASPFAVAAAAGASRSPKLAPPSKKQKPLPR